VKTYKILVLSPFYREFVKGIVDAMANDISEIGVLVHHNRLSEVSRYIPLGGYFSWVRTFTAERLIDATSRPDNVNVTVCSMTYLVPDGRNTRLGDAIVKRIDGLIEKNRLKFDLVQGHFTWPCGYAAVKLGAKHKKPAIVVVHEDRDWLLRMAGSPDSRFRMTWKNANGLVRVNKIDIPVLKEYNENVVHAPGGFNPSIFYPISREAARSAVGISGEQKVIFGLGYLDTRKGFQFLIQAMQDLVKTNPNLICIIGGTGPTWGELERQARTLGVDRNVRFAGFISRKELNNYYNAADIFVLPSLSEGNPTVMFEALSCGTPFIGTPVGGVPEVINSDSYGLLANTGSASDLAVKIERGLGISWDHARISAYAQTYSWENAVKPILELHRTLISPL